MRKFVKRPTALESTQACEIQSTGKKVTPDVEALAQRVADELASHEEPVIEGVDGKADEAIKVLEEEGVEVHAESDVKEKSFSDVMPSSEFYPDMPKAPLSDILGKILRVHDAQIIEDYEGNFGPSTFALMLCEDIVSGDMFTTLCGGLVVVKKLRRALADELLPLKGIITRHDRYYDIQ